MTFSAGFVRSLWGFWVLFVVYGSLVPLEFRHIALEQALARFENTPMLDIGLEGRADWIANGVLYVPVGFLTAVMLAGQGIGRRLLSSLLALGFGLTLAVAVEFSQLYFPPRTVSINDLVAEGLGTALGVLLAWRGTAWLAGLYTVLRGHWREVAASLVPAGALVVLLVSLFPYDLLVSSAELAGKAGGSFWGWLVAPAFAQEPVVRQIARLLSEAAVLVPLGSLWARSALTKNAAPRMRVSLQVAFWLGASLGLAIEVGQWFMASGVSQGISVLTRGAGWMLGAWLWNQRHVWGVPQWRATLRRFIWPLAAFHVLAIMVLSGLTSRDWRTGNEALARLLSGELRFVPFYYHYYTSEAVALQSLLTVAFMYAPIGLWCWALSLQVRHAAWIAALLALLVEAGKLLPMASRPDPTNVLIAAAAAAVSLLMLQRFSASGASTLPMHPQPAIASVQSVRPTAAGAGRPWWLMLPALVCAGYWLFHFPVYPAVVGSVIALCAVLVWWRPVLVFGVVAAALPSFDLSAFSGREYVDEFDVLLLVTVAVAWLRRTAEGPGPQQDRWLNIVLGAFVVSAVLAAWVAWRPWELAALQDPDSPLSPWYALRLLKGLLWALCLYFLARRQLANGQPVAQSFGVGLVVGLAFVSCFIFWERAVFVGLWDFSTPYRVAGPVGPMRLGGAYLDVFLVAALPFALVGALFGNSRLWRMVCGVTAVAAVYAVAVTFTRTTWLASLVLFFLIGLAALRPLAKKRTGAVVAIAFLAVMTAAVYPVATGSFASARMASVEEDFGVRMDHFSKALALGAADMRSSLVGNGLGQFPVRNYWASVATSDAMGPMAVHRFFSREGSSELQLGPGPHLYLDQFVELRPGEPVQVELKARAAGEGGKLSVLLCEKWLLSSDRCVASGFGLSDSTVQWQTLSALLDTAALNDGAALFGRPTRLALHNTGPVRMDIDEVSLRDGQGRELLRNGNFEAGSDHWSYTSDDHLAWHVKNMLIAVWFDQGALGLLALMALLGLGVTRSARSALAGDRTALALSAALVGLLIVSVFDSITDEPRYLLLLLVVAWMASITKGRSGGT